MDYSYLLNTVTASKWRKIGLKRRAGIAVPLFSIYSKNSIGIGEITDLSLLVDWCSAVGMTIIQLLPLNEIGSDHAPYNSKSTFAFEPSYLNLNKLKGIELDQFQAELSSLKKKFPQRKLRVKYSIKEAKLDLLWKIYQTADVSNLPAFSEYIELNKYWLDDYCLYKIIEELTGIDNWEKWEDKYKCRDIETLKSISSAKSDWLSFYKWVQWQLFEQMKEARQYAAEKGVLLMGDLPFLVSRASADVWSHQEYFKLNLSAGAPPDMYFALGQKWGMPPYDWFKIAEHGFIYLKEKLTYAANFYDMYRIDHFVGLFRVWTIPLDSPPEQAASSGKYEPQEEHLWEEYGKAIINEMLGAADMLPCAEDLGTVPAASYKVLNEYGIPGIEFQRYLKNPAANFGFKKPFEYRPNSIAVLSTHDSSFIFNWWKYEAGTIDERFFDMLLAKQGVTDEQIKELKKILFNKRLSKFGRLYWNDEINSRELFLSIVHPNQETENSLSYAYLDSFAEKWKFLEYIEKQNLNVLETSTELIKGSLTKINESASIFSIQLLHEYLALDEKLFSKMNRWSGRINTPGTVSNMNWSGLLPCPLEELIELEINSTIKEMLIHTERT